MSRRAHLLAALLAAGLPALALAGDITYPVDVDRTTWALLRDADNVLVREFIRWPRADGKRVRVPGHTWLQVIDDGPPEVDGRIWEVARKQDVKRAAKQLLITYETKWRSKEAIEASLDAAVVEHAMACAAGLDVQSACAAAAGIAQQLADGDLTATDGEKRRARKCSKWVKECVKPNEQNGDALLGLLREAYRTRNDQAPAPVPNLDEGWTDMPAP